MYYFNSFAHFCGLDIKLSPARCKLLCEKYENCSVDEFIEKLV